MYLEAQAIRQLHLQCENMTPDKIAALETQLLRFSLDLAAQIVHQHGETNCGPKDYQRYLNEAEAELIETNQFVRDLRDE